MITNLHTSTAEPRRRRDPRVPFGKTVLFKSRRTANEEGIVPNLSEGGLYLLSHRRYAPGTELIFFLPITEKAKSSNCIVSGRVIRAEDPVDSQYIGHGISFTEELSFSSRSQLRSFVSPRTRLPLRKEEPVVAAAPAPKKEPTRPEVRLALREAQERRKKSGRSFLILSITGLLALTLGLGYLLFRQPTWKKEINAIVSLSDVRIQDARLDGTVTADWSGMTETERRDRVTALGTYLLTKQVYNVVLVNDTGETVATILKNGNQRDQFSVRLSQ